ncbi:Ig-like domain-containing protein [Exiguobacterium sp. s154]|uniref:Ig-like domain-containing protein n=1 Tax=Exiguobacterium sp. s154 TaxID=2751277 RepID=UPI001BEC90D7|nr:Ig-like domain-containing protein [Exiguobacterium sp. s154]
MAKKKQFVTAAAAFAVAASAVAPAITADAATKTVRLSSDYVRVGDLDATLDKTYNGGEIHWYKSSVDLNKLGVFQTAKGFVKGQGIRVEKRVRVLNYAQEIKPESEFVFEQGVPVSGIRVQPVLFADGNEYAKPVSVAGFNTDKVGEFEGTLTYANRAYGLVTKTVKYKVVASEVEISNVSSSVDQAAEVLSVNADVKNLKDGEKVELVVYPGKDTSATPIKADATVKDGKLTVSKKLPAGTHSFQLVSGDVKTEIKDFTIEAPMVKDVKAINAKEILVTFNKAVDETSAELVSNYQLQGADLTGADTITLQSDKKSVVIELGTALVNNKSYALKVKKDLIKDANDASRTIAEHTETIFFNDTVKPTVSSVETLENGNVKVKFSERIDTSVKPSVVIDGTTVAAANVTVDASGEFATVTGLSLTKGKSYQIIVTSAQDIASTPNVMSLYSGSFVYNIMSEAPVVKSVSAKNENTITVEFTEALSAALSNGTTLNVTKNGIAVTPSSITPVGGNGKFEIALPSTVYATGEKAIAVAVTLEGYKDLQGNVGTKYVQNVSLNKDVSAPVVKESNYNATTDRLTVKFDEALSASTAAVYAPNMYVTDGNGVRYNVATAGTSATEVLTVSDISAGQDTLTLNTTELPNGSYTLTVLGNTFSDQSFAANANAITNVNFTVTDSVATTKPSILAGGAGATITKGQIVLNFDAPVKGGNVAGSATDYANYSINGVTIPSTSAIYLDTAKQQVTIKLPAGTVDASGVKLLTVKGIQGTNGVAMVETTRAESFVDDTAPVLQSAKVDASNVLNVKFSEALAGAPVATTDLEVAINGTVITGYTAVAVSGKPGEYTIAAPAGYSFATGTITVKVNNTATAADADSNVLKSGTVVTATR